MLHHKEDERRIREFYNRLLKYGHITDHLLYHSHIHYARWMIYERTGQWYSLEHVMVAAWLEGLIDPDDLKDLPEWYVEKYMGGVKPNVEALRESMKRAKSVPVSEELATDDLGVPWKT